MTPKSRKGDNKGGQEISHTLASIRLPSQRCPLAALLFQQIEHDYSKQRTALTIEHERVLWTLATR